MLEPLENLPEGVLGFRAVGVIEPKDYLEVLDPAIDAVIAEHAKVNMVYLVGDDFDRYSLGALWQDTKLGTRPLKTWGRIAFVSNHDWLNHAVSFFAFLTPGEAKSFPLEELDAATEWAAG